MTMWTVLATAENPRPLVLYLILNNNNNKNIPLLFIYQAGNLQVHIYLHHGIH